MSDDDNIFDSEFKAEFSDLEVVGAGGMARVFKARQKSLGRDVAVKVLAPQAFTEEDSKLRFEREREVTSKLKHPNIVPLLSFGETRGRPYLVFEFIDGPSLRDVLLREGKLPLVRALATARQIAQGLAAAHAAGIVHRDLKPDNVLIGADGEARVADFGLARPLEMKASKRLTQTGIILGTPGYLAPELIRGDPATPAADLFSLGIMLQEMICGKLPMDASSEHEMLVRYLREDIPPLSARGVNVPARVERIVSALLRRDADKRAADATKVAEALQHAEAKGDTPDGPQTRPRSRGDLDHPASKRLETPRLTPFSGARFVRKHPGITAVAVGMLLAIVVGGIGSAVYLARPEPPPAVEYRVSVEPTVVAGVTSASLRWQTNLPAPTSVWIWRDGQGDGEGLQVLPPPHAPASGVRHELTVRGLQRDSRWSFRVMFPDGSRSSEHWPIELKSDIANIVGPHTCRYVDASTVEISFEVKADVTAGMHLEGPGQPEVVWAPSRGAKRVSLRLALREKGQAWTPVVRFRELDDPDPRQEPLNRKSLARVPSLDALRRDVVALWQGTRPLEMHTYTAEILKLGAKYYHISAGGLPTKAAVEALKEQQRRELLATAWQNVRAKLLGLRGVDLELVKSALPLWREDAGLAGEDRRQLHEALMRLSDLDGACQLIAGAPLLDLDEQLRLRVPPLASEELAPRAFRVLKAIDDPHMQEVLRFHAYPMFTHLTWPDDPGLIAAADIADSKAGGIIDAARAVAVPDSGDLDTATGIWQKLPELPEGFPTDGKLRIAIRVTSLAPEYRIWIRIGSAKVCFRGTLREFAGYLSVPLKAPRADIEAAAIPMAIELPAGYCDPGTRLLMVRLEAFSPRDGTRTLAPMVCWLSELAIIPK